MSKPGEWISGVVPITVEEVTVMQCPGGERPKVQLTIANTHLGMVRVSLTEIDAESLCKDLTSSLRAIRGFGQDLN